MNCKLLISTIFLTFGFISCQDSTGPGATKLMANAGLDQTIIAGSYAIFDATQSTGSYNWLDWQQDENNPEKVKIFSETSSAGNKGYIHKIVFVKEGIYKFRLIVRSGVTTSNYNGTDASEPDTLIITVKPNPDSKFEDLNLEAIIRAKLNKQLGELNETILLSLDSLSCADVIPQQRIYSLKGIENCKNLTYLLMGLQDISDISPLAELKKLKILWLDQNYKISDITPLASLTNLEELHLQNNIITDISSLKDLTKLRELELQNNPVKNITALMNLNNLTYLYLSDASFTDISPLRNSLNLKQLWLINCNISDIYPLANLVNIEDLHLAWNHITDITSLENMTKLNWVALEKNEISDISSLKDLQNLDYVRLWDNQITDIKPLVDNQGIGKDDIVGLDGNPLSEKSINEYIPALQVRAVIVTW